MKLTFKRTLICMCFFFSLSRMTDDAQKHTTQSNGENKASFKDISRTKEN